MVATGTTPTAISVSVGSVLHATTPMATIVKPCCKRNRQQGVGDRVERPAVAEQPVERIAERPLMAMRKRARLQLVVEIGGDVVDHALAGAHPAIGRRHFNEARQPVGKEAAIAATTISAARVVVRPVAQATAGGVCEPKAVSTRSLSGHGCTTARPDATKQSNDQQGEAAPLAQEISGGMPVVRRERNRRPACCSFGGVGRSLGRCGVLARRALTEEDRRCGS